MNKDKIPWVNASDVGKAEFCAYSLYLAKKGVRPSKQTQVKMAEGTKSHRQWDRDRAPGRAVWIRVIVVLVLVVIVAWWFKT